MILISFMFPNFLQVNSQLLRNDKGLREVFTLCACILGIINFPTTNSAPTMDGKNPVDFNAAPMWESPCNIGEPGSHGPESLDKDLTYESIVSKIFMQAEYALSNFASWKDRWAQDTFQKDFTTYFHEFKTSMNPPSYLPNFNEVNKEYTMRIPDGVLPSVNKDKVLQNIFEWFQRVAVGMEQVVYDKFTTNDQFKDDVKKSYDDLRIILCEIHEAMLLLNIEPSKHVDRSIMPESERNSGSDPSPIDSHHTARNVRDGTIFIIYGNLLEYAKELFNYLQRND